MFILSWVTDIVQQRHSVQDLSRQSAQRSLGLSKSYQIKINNNVYLFYLFIFFLYLFIITHPRFLATLNSKFCSNRWRRWMRIQNRWWNWVEKNRNIRQICFAWQLQGSSHSVDAQIALVSLSVPPPLSPGGSVRWFGDGSVRWCIGDQFRLFPGLRPR